MGILVPEDFPMSSLANEEERTVVQAFCDRLSDGWVVIPDVGLAGTRDRQMDVVIAHEREGVAVVEVKGHRVRLRGGLFCADHGPLDPQPDRQASENAYALRNRLRACSPALADVRVEYAIAFPNTAVVRGDLPPNLLRAQILTSTALEDPVNAVDRLMASRWNQAIGADGLKAVVTLLRPDAEFEWDPEAQARRARDRLEQLCSHQTRTLEQLDANRKVLVTGGAGSGKTRLAVAWARRALARGERVLLTCYNDPLGDVMKERFAPNEHLTVGSFFRVALALDGMTELEIPDDASGRWWDTVAVGHLHSNWPGIRRRFDTVIVDEAQDFSPAWLAQLAQLLDPTGPRRMMLLVDEAQGVYQRGFVLPERDEGWARCELVDNCRNTFQIASILQRRLGGTAAALGGPESIDVRWREADDVETAVEMVGEEIDWIEAAGHAAPSVLVTTITTSVRDRLREAMAFVRWEDRQQHAVVCENVHRVKGLEFDFVILVVTTDDVPDLLLYVGLSRAVVGFSLVGPATVAERLGLARAPGDAGRPDAAGDGTTS